MYYKTIAQRLSRNGWRLEEEGHGNLIPNYFKYVQYCDRDMSVIEITAKNNKDGTPGEIMDIYKDGKLFTYGRYI